MPPARSKNMTESSPTHVHRITGRLLGGWETSKSTAARANDDPLYVTNVREHGWCMLERSERLTSEQGTCSPKTNGHQDSRGRDCPKRTREDHLSLLRRIERSADI